MAPETTAAEEVVGVVCLFVFASTTITSPTDLS